MQRVEIETDTIHSDKSQQERDATMKNFRSGETKVLIATDVSARGIDIPNVDFVINYDLPESGENYVHRVGRTGRGRLKGQAVSFCSSEELDLLELIEEKLANKIPVLEISKKDYKETLQIEQRKSNDWQSLMKEAEQLEQSYKKKKKKKRK